MARQVASPAARFCIKYFDVDCRFVIDQADILTQSRNKIYRIISDTTPVNGDGLGHSFKMVKTISVHIMTLITYIISVLLLMVGLYKILSTLSLTEGCYTF